MPRRPVPWYRPHIHWPSLAVLAVCTAAACLAVWGLRRANPILGTLIGAGALAFAVSALRSLWRHRHPFDFTVRGDHQVRILGDGRDAVIVEEDGVQFWVHTELLRGRLERRISRDSVRRVVNPVPHSLWSPPVRRDDLAEVSPEQRDRIVALICESCDFAGVRHEVV